MSKDPKPVSDEQFDKIREYVKDCVPVLVQGTQVVVDTQIGVLCKRHLIMSTTKIC